MWLIVGLGNPGKKYEWTRHNVGFLAIDHFLKSLNAPLPQRQEHKALTSKVRLGDKDILLVQPQTFMNLSGDSVISLVNYYKIEVSQILVLHDEVDLPFGSLKMQRQRGHGGNNGIRDIHKKLGTNEYARIRIGVGRPPAGSKQSVANFVLNPFSKIEIAELSDILDTCGDGIEKFIDEGYEKAATRVNSSTAN